MFKHITTLAIAVLLLACKNTSAASECQDFLKVLNKLPATAQYIGCEVKLDYQGSPMIASYKVAGKNASTVEAYLHKQFSTKIKLQRNCCIWEMPEEISYQDSTSASLYRIQMHSEETPVRARDEWFKVDNFYLTVTTFTEEI